jgi:hypothetical protein
MTDRLIYVINKHGDVHLSFIFNKSYWKRIKEKKCACCIIYVQHVYKVKNKNGDKHRPTYSIHTLPTTLIQCVPLATELGISLIILTPMKILQRNLNRGTFVVWEMKRSMSVVCVCSAPNCCDTEQRSASQPACFLPDAPLCCSLCHLAEGAYTIRLLFVSVSACVSPLQISL